ncbi:MAG: ABC transporter permease, partial [Clostridiales bacterium]|nr:ABC transporter permease [Clostridiales bacterium]
MTTIKSIAKQVLFYALLAALWQGLYYLGVSVLGVWKPYAFPNPVGVWKSLVSLFNQNALFNAIFFSLRRAFTGYALSVFAGVLTGLLLYRFTLLKNTVKPLILGIQTLPSICWVPFAVLWFGLRESAIIFVIVMGSAFSVAIAVDMAIRSVNPIYIKAAKTMGAKGLDLYFKVIFPASLPPLITGMKQGWSFAWRSLMAGEVMSATVGLGQALTMGRDLADINRVMLIIL